MYLAAFTKGNAFKSQKIKILVCENGLVTASELTIKQNQEEDDKKIIIDEFFETSESRCPIETYVLKDMEGQVIQNNP